MVGGEWTHNVHRESVPRALGLYSPSGLLAMAIITPSLALWATLGHLNADSAASFVGIAVAKQLPQSLTAEMCGCVAPVPNGELPPHCRLEDAIKRLLVVLDQLEGD